MTVADRQSSDAPRVDGAGPVPPGLRPASAAMTQRVLADNLGNVPAVLQENWRDLGNADIPKERYISREFYNREVDLMWRRTWQMACFESDIAQPGDYVVYDIAWLSFIIVRSAPDQIKAYFNACPHRGTQLRENDGTAAVIRCPFHGWTWNLDGTLKELPADWDLPHVDPARACLPEAQVDTWGGMVFINPDPSGISLEEFLDPMPEHWSRWWPMERRAPIAHICKVFRANWKVVLAAFIEGYHFPVTHPQLAAKVDGEIVATYGTQYDFYARVSRLLAAAPRAAEPVPTSPISVSSEAGDHHESDGREVKSEIERAIDREGRGSARQALAAQLGVPEDRLAPEEGLDLIVYHPFPNLQIGASAFPFVTRFRPHRDDPEMSVMDVWVMSMLAENAPRPPKPTVHHLGPDDSFHDAPEIGIPEVYDQDARNVRRVQRGLHTTLKDGITLARYQESLIRHHNDLLSAYLSEHDRPTPDRE